MSNKQYGFIKGRSTMLQLLHMKPQWSYSLIALDNNNYKLYVKNGPELPLRLRTSTSTSSWWMTGQIDWKSEVKYATPPRGNKKEEKITIIYENLEDRENIAVLEVSRNQIYLTCSIVTPTIPVSWEFGTRCTVESSVSPITTVKRGASGIEYKMSSGKFSIFG